MATVTQPAPNTSAHRVDVTPARTDSALSRARWFLSDIWVMTQRNLMRYVRLPQLMVFSTIQPVMFLLLFTFVFGGAIQVPGFDYINYLLPGIILQTALFGSSQTGIGLAEDMAGGLVDRFRSLPMARFAVLAGRTFSDMARNLFVILLMVSVGALLGFRINNGLGPALLALLIALGFAYAFSWVSAMIGLAVRDLETAQVAGFIWIFPLTFASSAFAPTATMPAWLRVFAENNPVTHAVNAVRGLTQGQVILDASAQMGNMMGAMRGAGAEGGLGGLLRGLVQSQQAAETVVSAPTVGSAALWSLAWIVGLLVVFVPLATARFRKVE